MYKDSEHYFTDEFDDINVLISLTAGLMNVYVSDEEHSSSYAMQCLNITEYVELVREFHYRAEKKGLSE